ncbi:MAG: thiamine phosphate synthase [Chloroflexota bacterium]
MPRPQLPRPVLMLVTDLHQFGDRDFSELIRAAVQGGVNCVQIREQALPVRELLELAKIVIRDLPSGSLSIVNNRLDVALAAGTDGVQLGAASIPVRAARSVAQSLLIGASVHSLDEATQATNAGADYLIVGTMFPTQSHPGKTPEGLPLMQAIRAKVTIPLIGIGGISASNARLVMEAGADGVAVISEIQAASDPAEATRRLRRALD